MRSVSFLFFFLTVSFLNAQLRDTLQLFFGSDLHDLSASEQQKLVSYMSRMDTVVIQMIGIAAYCDDQGDGPYNDTLSAKRAAHIHQQLLSLEVDPKLITREKGMGEVPLRGARSADRERSFNRRADLVVFYTVPEKQTLLSDSMKVGEKITLDNILFEGGRHILLPESGPALKRLVVALRQKPQYSICILGHICCSAFGVDGLDNDTGIWDLSVARAQVIHNYLITQGISPDRLTYKGLKADFPLGKGDKYDRRVEIEITEVKE